MATGLGHPIADWFDFPRTSYNKMITQRDISQAVQSQDDNQLTNIYGQLVVEKMKLDRFFTTFLDENEMNDDDLDTPEWVTYKMMLQQYDRVQTLLTTTRYYLQ